MANFYIDQPALEVCKTLVDSYPIAKVRLIIHKVGLNWSQMYSTNSTRKQKFIEAYSHVKRFSRVIEISQSEFLRTDLKEFQLSKNEVVSFCSLMVLSNGDKVHFPMMNFHPENDFSLIEIIDAITFLYPGMQGVLLNSGRFSHYYGNFLLSQSEWEAFLGSFLIPFSLVHPGYIGYRLTEGYSTLRLTKDEEFKPQIPYVIKILEN